MIAGTLGPWCSVPWRPGPIGLLPRRSDRLNVDRRGAISGCFCLWSSGVRCRVLLRSTDSTRRHRLRPRRRGAGAGLGSAC